VSCPAYAAYRKSIYESFAFARLAPLNGRQRVPAASRDFPQLVQACKVGAGHAQFLDRGTGFQVFAEEEFDSPDVESLDAIDQVDVDHPALIVSHATARAVDQVLNTGARPALPRQGSRTAHRRHEVPDTAEMRVRLEETCPDSLQSGAVAADRVDCFASPLVHQNSMRPRRRQRCAGQRLRRVDGA
jgi:hypothetical protein